MHSILKSEASAGSDWLYDQVRQEVDVEPSATVGLDLNPAAIRDVSYDSHFDRGWSGL